MADQSPPARTMSDALGGFGARPRVTVRKGTPEERTYYFTLDVPLVLSEIEQLCLQWAREQLAAVLRSLPEKDRPGTLDHDLAREEWELYRTRLRAGDFRLDGPGYKEFVKTRDGQMAAAVASLRPSHPDATAATVVTLYAEAREEMEAVFDTLGKVMAALTAGVTAAQQTQSPG